MDCVKIFASVYDVKPIGFRLLQYNFVNSSGEPWVPDQLTLYDGDIYNMTTKPLVNIKVQTTFCIKQAKKHNTGSASNCIFFPSNKNALFADQYILSSHWIGRICSCCHVLIYISLAIKIIFRFRLPHTIYTRQQ